MFYLEIALLHGILLFNSKMISALACVNKEHNQMILKTVPYRKNYFIMHDNFLQEMQQKNVLSHIVWDKYAINCGIVQSEQVLSSSTIGIIMARRSLGADVTHYIRWRCFDNYLPHHPKPFFNESGELCLYALCNFTHHIKDVAEYCVPAVGKRHKKLCIAQNNGVFWDLKIFLEFPVLLQAILESQYVIEEKCLEYENSSTGIVKTFFLEGATIPKNYKKHQQYFANHNDYASFHDLPKELRKAVSKRVKEGKKKKKWLGLL